VEVGVQGLEIAAKIEAARDYVADSPFVWTFEGENSLIEVSGVGIANAHHFTGFTGPVHLTGGPENPLLQAVVDLRRRLHQTADRFHRALPMPVWTQSQESAMSYEAQVDEALSQYKGMSLQALSLGPDEWKGFLDETGLAPDEDGNVRYRQVLITAGISGIKYIVS
jgi:hypothetical protein